MLTLNIVLETFIHHGNSYLEKWKDFILWNFLMPISFILVMWVIKHGFPGSTNIWFKFHCENINDENISIIFGNYAIKHHPYLCSVLNFNTKQIPSDLICAALLSLLSSGAFMIKFPHGYIWTLWECDAD